jgi:aspartate carbamoyltransferase regulatory subunit
MTEHPSTDHEKKNEKKLYIEKIRNGTVIDHIKAGFAVYVLKILGLDGKDGSLITVGINVKSTSSPTGKKDIVKVENIYLDEKQINQVALIAPDSKVSFIKEYEVSKKIIVKVPNVISGLVKCPNDKCISNADREPIISEFNTLSTDPLKIGCIYCERILTREEIIDLYYK